MTRRGVRGSPPDPPRPGPRRAVTEFEFILLFLPVVVAAHYGLRSVRDRTRLLVAASIVFYAAWDVRFLPLILGSVAGNFLLGRAIHRGGPRRRRILVLGILFNLIPLAFCFTLPINFLSPYKARSIADFWRRWHITLSRFLRDYLYIPLGGNRRGRLARYRNLMITMLLGGLWHGAGWTFVLWGGAHGLLLAIERLIRDRFPRLTLGPLARPVTFVLVALLWVPFRAESLQATARVYRGLVDFGAWSVDRDVEVILLAALLVLGPSSHAIARALERLPEALRRYPYRLRRRALAYVAASHLLVALGAYAFYAGELERQVYRVVPIRTTTDGIDNTRGDFRTNLYQQEVLHGDERKVIVVGSSFTRGLGCFRFEKDGATYKSGTIGIGGNTVVNALRSATAVLELERLEAIVVGVSPLNLGPVRGRCAFAGEGMSGVNAMGFDLAQRPFAEVEPVDFGPRDLLAFSTRSRDRRYRQIHGFLYNLSTALEPSRVEIRSLDLSRREEFLDTLAGAVEEARRSPLPVPDRDNGSDERFRWNERGILESLAPGGDFRRAMRALAAECDRRGVRLVVYDTPTPDHDAAPQIYPEGFLDAYRARMLELVRATGIEYHDLTDLFPWSGRFMKDFVHLQPDARPVLHQLLLYRLYGDER